VSALVFYAMAITSDKHLKILAKAMASMKKVRKVNIQCRYQLFGDEGLKHLSKGLQRLGLLQSISLDFSETKATDEGLIHLSECLRRLSFLKSLSLNFTFCQRFTKKGLIFLTKSIKRLSSLQVFTVKFSHCEMKEEIMLKSIDECLHRLDSLQSINLLIGSSASQATNQSSKILNKSLQRLSLLKSIALNFLNCKTITDESLKNLGENVSFLQSFTLGFVNNITDKGLVNLSEGFNEFSSLKSLSLVFIYCHKITDEGLKIWIQSLKKLGSLQSLSLKFQLLVIFCIFLFFLTLAIFPSSSRFCHEFSEGLLDILLLALVRIF